MKRSHLLRLPKPVGWDPWPGVLITFPLGKSSIGYSTVSPKSRVNSERVHDSSFTVKFDPREAALQRKDFLAQGGAFSLSDQIFRQHKCSTQRLYTLRKYKCSDDGTLLTCSAEPPQTLLNILNINADKIRTQYRSINCKR